MSKYLYLFLFVCNTLSSQSDMSHGFELLELNKFKAATEYFYHIVELDPNSKTGNICLGRAIGLGGDPKLALDIFQNLTFQYPDDFELSLNIAEAHLWNNKPDQALTVYTKLINLESTNFTANLGLANTQFQLKNFDKALVSINKALMIEPENQSALTSRKYIQLALASQYTNEFNFHKAIIVLDQILMYDKKSELALFNKAINFIHLKKYRKADEILTVCSNLNPDNIEVLLLSSHLSILRHKEKVALSYADHAVQKIDKTDTLTLIRGIVQKINALGALKKFAEAKSELSNYMNIYGNQPALQLANARLKVWEKELNAGLKLYDEINEESYELFMGKAEAYLAAFKYSLAAQAIDAALQINPKSIDAIRLKNEILDRNKVSVNIDGNSSNDVGQNKAKEINVGLNIPVGDKHIISLQSGFRKTLNPILDKQADLWKVHIGDNIQINQRITCRTSLGLISHQESPQYRKINYFGDGALSLQITKNQTLDFGFKKENLNYSSDLIQSGYSNNNFFLAYQFVRPKWPSFYTQLNRSMLSDGNSSYNIFSSVYYEIKAFPVIKLGLNANQISFDEDRSFIYFSPEKYQMLELFFHIGNNYNQKAKFFYSGMIAIGKQKVGKANIEDITRIDLQVGYKLKPGLQIIANYFTNSAASSNIKGYSFERFGCKMNITF